MCAENSLVGELRKLLFRPEVVLSVPSAFSMKAFLLRPPHGLGFQRKPPADDEIPIAKNLCLDAPFAVIAQLGGPGDVILAE
jgi:hypothetical protein